VTKKGIGVVPSASSNEKSILDSRSWPTPMGPLPLTFSSRLTKAEI
jgi:hypothetical protein